MQVNVLIDHGEELVAPLDITGLVIFTLTRMGLPAQTDVTISFVTNERIHELNREYRGMDKPTDVLSFECDNIPFEGENMGAAKEFELGDVVIATDVARAQTQEFGTSFEEEITLLTVHGLLHLCGYDHVADEEAKEMEALERDIIDAWNSVRIK